MVGLPMEKSDDIRATIEFIKEIKPDSINLCTFCPLPGTVLFDQLAEKGLLDKDINPSYYDTVALQSIDNYFATAIPRKQYNILVREAMKEAERATLRLSRTDIKAIFRKLTNARFIGRILKKPTLLLGYARILASRMKY
jgi:radical SAM superfamily enzyme YgiQ (UPF0313 family)